MASRILFGMKLRRHFMAVVFLLIAAGVVRGAEPAAEEKLASVRIDNVPFVRQEPDFCGEACAAMWLNHLGKPVDQDYVFNRSGLDPALGQGCDTPDLARALTAIGFQIGPVWYPLRADQAQHDVAQEFRAMHADLVAGVPSIVCMRLSDKPDAAEHFRLLVGYDAKRDEVLYHEPLQANGAYTRMARETFLKRLPLNSADHRQTVVRFRLAVGKLADIQVADATASPANGERPKTPADFAQHVLRLKRTIPAGGHFTILIQPPFVVVGDEPAATVKSRCQRLVKWTVDHIKQTYFPRDPDRILDIWLFKDKQSYDTNVEKIFGETPTTPYGYFSAQQGALVMNIATGGGTLVHEIVHPYMAANFPKCPAWFNEGLASLYEHCGEVKGEIHGYPNWRLTGLQKAIQAGALPSFEKLCATTTEQFYGEKRGVNYGQARYLCYYLQENDLLKKYYREFHDHADTDPTGYKTLQKVLGEPDMAAFQKRWQEFVMKLELE